MVTPDTAVPSPGVLPALGHISPAVGAQLLLLPPGVRPPVPSQPVFWGHCHHTAHGLAEGRGLSALTAWCLHGSVGAGGAVSARIVSRAVRRRLVLVSLSPTPRPSVRWHLCRGTCQSLCGKESSRVGKGTAVRGGWCSAQLHPFLRTCDGAAPPVECASSPHTDVPLHFFPRLGVIFVC